MVFRLCEQAIPDEVAVLHLERGVLCCSGKGYDYCGDCWEDRWDDILKLEDRAADREIAQVAEWQGIGESTRQDLEMILSGGAYYSGFHDAVVSLLSKSGVCAGAGRRCANTSATTNGGKRSFNELDELFGRRPMADIEAVLFVADRPDRDGNILPADELRKLVDESQCIFLGRAAASAGLSRAGEACLGREVQGRH